MSKFLPEELAIEILVRLSMKDLARFRCVCKTWRDLINNREFSERYLDISPTKFVSFYNNGFYLLDVEGKNPVIKTPHNKLDFPLDHQSIIDESTCVLHCDGMLCVTLKNHTLMIWNPSSNHFKIVPNPGIYRDSNILGFGYDPVYDDYKLVTFIDRIDSSNAHVFEFRTGSWRDTVRIPYPDWHYRERRGTFLDQYLYWIAYRSNVDRFILCFNLSTHEYRKFPLPVYNKCATCCSWLGVTSQKLCVTDYEPGEKEILISVMDKTGSWNKITTFSISDLNSVLQDCNYEVEFVSFTKKNDLLVTFTEYYGNLETESEEGTKKKVFLYKTGEETFEEVRLCNSIAGFRFLSEYVETLVITNQIFV